MALMNEVLRPFIDRFILVYLNYKKCRFGVDQLVFLSHTITASRISPDPEKVKAVEEWPKPRNLSVEE